MLRSIVLCALFLGVANAARQIPVNPSPPPPGPTSDAVPGALVSVIAPDYSQSTWTSVQSDILCAALIANYTSLYEKKYIKCSVNGVVSTASYPAAAVQTQLYWSDFTGSTAADKANAASSRDLFVNTLAANPDNIAMGGKVGNVNDTCNSAWSPTLTYTSSDPYVKIDGMPLAQCRIQMLGVVAAETYAAGVCTAAGAPTTALTTSQNLCFESASTSTVGSYGIDNGKVCPKGAGFVQPAVVPTGVTVVQGTIAAIAASVSGNIEASTGTLQQISIVALTATTDFLSANFIPGQSMVRLAGFTVQAVVGSCAADEATDFLRDTPSLVTGYTAIAGGGGSARLTVTVDWAASGCGAAATVGLLATANTASSVINAWSPYCDSNQAFYNAFNALITTNTNSASANVCPACGTSASDAIRFTYSGPNSGKACRTGAFATENGVVGTPQNVQTAGLAGTSCIQVGAANYPASSVDSGKPMLSDDSLVPYPYSATTYAFPSSAGCTQPNIQQPCAAPGSFPDASVVAFNGGTRTVGTTTGVSIYQSIAVDSEFNIMCSTPAVRSPISSALKSTGIVSDYFLGDGGNVIRGAGTCNTRSLWWNGGLGAANGITSAGRTMADLPTTFLAPIITPTPAPAPVMPAPAPVMPAPAPVAPTPTAPTPSSPTPLVCTYRGTYEITPLYGPCNKYYIASGTKSNCAENFVHLRTKSNLGGKYDRVRWAIAATAQNGVGTPTRVVAEARSGVGACTNRNLAAPSNPIPGLKVGGSSWQWQFRPYPDSAECDHVNMISENRLDTTAFLSVPKPCKTFRYNESDGGRQRFKLIKV